MADPFSAEAFYASAQHFAVSALEARHAGNHRHVPLHAGTALEHLAKAALAHRSPALLAEMRGESGIKSVAALLRIPCGEPWEVRTIGLTEALERVQRFVKPRADLGPLSPLRALVNLRNGTAHAAGDEEMEEHILAAFLQYCDVLLADLKHDRSDFWGAHLPVVDALLREASDEVAYRVDVRIAEAEAYLDRRISTEGETLIAAVRALSGSVPLAAEERFRDCPVCGSAGVATGDYSVEWVPNQWDEGDEVIGVDGQVWFTVYAYRCPVCLLKLNSEAEVRNAFHDAVWLIEGGDWRRCEPDYRGDEDEAYERWREETRGL